MSVYSAMTTEYYGIPLWGWILIILGIVGLIMGISAMMNKKKADANKEGTAASGTDVEAANVKLPEGQPPKTPSPAQQFPRDAPLPPPAPSETSNKA